MKIASLLLTIFFGMSGEAFAFQGTIIAKNSHADELQTLTLSRWSVDRRGVPSFNYSFTQTKSRCNYQVSGHAVAGFTENGKKVDLEIFNPQEEDGGEAPSITAFHDGDVTFTVPSVEKKHHMRITFEDEKMRKKLPFGCKQSASDYAILFISR